MIKKIIFLFILLLPCRSFAQFKVNVDIILKRGVDKGLVLVNELHSVEPINENKMIRLKMKNGLSVELIATFVSSDEDYGPSGKIRFTGKVLDNTEKLIKSLDKENIIIPIGESQKIICEGVDDQLIEITLRPEL